MDAKLHPPRREKTKSLKKYPKASTELLIIDNSSTKALKKQHFCSFGMFSWLCLCSRFYGTGFFERVMPFLIGGADLDETKQSLIAFLLDYVIAVNLCPTCVAVPSCVFFCRERIVQIKLFRWLSRTRLTLHFCVLRSAVSPKTHC